MCIYDTSHWILLRMRNISDKSHRENKNGHLISNNTYPTTVPFIRRRGKYGTARKDKLDNITRRMRFVIWITEGTDTHSEYVKVIAFSRQQWLRERASILRLYYIACLVRGTFRGYRGVNEGKRPLGRPRRSWEDNIKMDLQEVGGSCGDWMELAQDRDRWRHLWVRWGTFGFQKCGEFLD